MDPCGNPARAKLTIRTPLPLKISTDFAPFRGGCNGSLAFSDVSVTTLGVNGDADPEKDPGAENVCDELRDASFLSGGLPVGATWAVTTVGRIS